MEKQTPVGGNRRLLGSAFVAAVLAVLILLNVSINALAARFGWYLYTEEKYEHTIGNASYEVFRDVAEGEKVRVLFCMSRDSLESDVIYSLVHNTILQLAERHDFIEVEYKNIYLRPAEVEPFRTRVLSGSEEVSYTINEQSVIFVNGEDEKNFRVESLQSFFILDSSGVITGYNGEEISLACLSWVMKDTHPIAGFTAAHGENFGNLLAFSTALVAAGYDVSILDLSTEVPSGVGLVVIANPRWDLDRGAEGSGILAELDYLASYLDAGGSLFVSLDPYVKSDLSGLRGFLAERGLSATQEVIRDSENSITYDGFTLVTRVADGALATEIAGRIGDYTTSRAIVKEGSAILCGEADGWKAEPILLSSETAKTYKSGEITDSEGSYPVFAASRRTVGETTSTILLSSSVYLLANDVMNSATYSNRDVILASLESTADTATPVGCRILAIGNERLEDLTMRAARGYAWLLVGAIPLAVVAVGAIVIVRRKTR